MAVCVCHPLHSHFCCAATVWAPLTPTCKAYFDDKGNNRLFRLWLTQYQRSVNEPTVRAAMLGIEDSNFCCGWGPPNQCKNVRGHWCSPVLMLVVNAFLLARARFCLVVCMFVILVARACSCWKLARAVLSRVRHSDIASLYMVSSYCFVTKPCARRPGVAASVERR